jgi:UDPglucose 6-dehydrogenase
MNSRTKITIVGLGYVGLANLALLSTTYQAVGVDIEVQKVDQVNSGISPIHDAELTEFLANKPKQLTATTNLLEAMVDADFALVCVPTDFSNTEGRFNTDLLEQVTGQILAFSNKVTVILKSTLPIGFTSGLRARLNTDRIIFSPEFLREGKALHDSFYPSRIVVGGQSKRAMQFSELLRRSARKADVPVLLTNSNEAEAIKLFSNTYLAMRVAFFNELDTYAIQYNMNALDIVKGVTGDPRIGDHYCNPSFGYGGYCLPKDSKQLLSNFFETPQNMIGATVEANQTRIKFIVESIAEQGANKIGIYRLKMKAESDNFRQSTVIQVASLLQQKGLKVVAYEPLIKESYFDSIKIENNLQNFKKNSDLIVANRLANELSDVLEKIYTRDLFGIN